MSEKDRYEDCSCTASKGNTRNKADKNTSDRAGESPGGSVSNGFRTTSYVSGDSAGTSSAHQYSKTGSDSRINQGDRLNFGDGANHGDKL